MAIKRVRQEKQRRRERVAHSRRREKTKDHEETHEKRETKKKEPKRRKETQHNDEIIREDREDQFGNYMCTNNTDITAGSIQYGASSYSPAEDKGGATGGGTQQLSRLYSAILSPSVFTFTSDVKTSRRGGRNKKKEGRRKLK